MTRSTFQRLAALVPLAFVVLSSACSSVPTSDIRMKAEANPKVRFEGYGSYAWLMEAAVLRDPLGAWEPPEFDMDSQIKFLIDRELRARGWKEDSANADLRVVFLVGVDMQAMRVHTEQGDKLGVLESVPRGALVISLIDVKTGQVAWAGIAEADVQEGATEEVVQARLDYAVTQLIKQIPK